MLRNYLTTAFRTLRRRPGYAAINLAGLGVGLACCLLILLFVQHEYGVNRGFEKGGSVYRVNTVWPERWGEPVFLSPAPLGHALKTEFAGVSNALRYTAVDADIRVGDTPSRCSVLIAGSELFEFFDFTFVAGDPETALRNPDSVVLTEPEALRLFGRTNVVGEAIHVSTWGGDGEKPYQVTGVLAQPPFNSITYIGRQENKVIVPFANAADFFGDAAFDSDWSINNTVTYVELDARTRPEVIEEQLPALLERHLPAAQQGQVSLQLEALAEVYLNDFGGAARRLGRLLLLVALLILGVACFNYINISTALAVARAREVGMRKVLGASRRQLVGQFVGESVLVCGLGMIVGVVLAGLGIGPFNTLVERTLELAYTTPGFWLTVGGLALVVGIVGGAYPAFYLAAVEPMRSLKTLAGSGRAAMGVRRGLVVVQFTAAIGLFIAAVVIQRQAALIAEQDTGFDREQVLVLSSLPREWTVEGVAKLDVIKRAVLDVPGVEHASIAWGPPGPRYTGVTWDVVPEGGDADAAVSLPVSQVDAGFLETVGIELAGGVFFDPFQADSEPVVVLNEAAARLFGWEEPLGRTITTEGISYRVLGVVSDYHTEGLERPIGPMALVDVRQVPLYRELLVRVPAEGAEETLESLRAVWADVYPSVAFEYYFLDDQWVDLHAWIWRTRAIAGWATGLAIFVALLGLLGVVSISVGHRTKEIGIRKVVGASAPSLVRLLSMDVLKLVALAFLLAAPLAYIAVNRWLEGFANRVEVGMGVMVGGGVLVLVAAGLAVGTQALRAVLMNPVDALRDE